MASSLLLPICLFYIAAHLIEIADCGRFVALTVDSRQGKQLFYYTTSYSLVFPIYQVHSALAFEHKIYSPGSYFHDIGYFYYDSNFRKFIYINPHLVPYATKQHVFPLYYLQHTQVSVGYKLGFTLPDKCNVITEMPVAAVPGNKLLFGYGKKPASMNYVTNYYAADPYILNVPKAAEVAPPPAPTIVAPPGSVINGANEDEADDDQTVVSKGTRKSGGHRSTSRSDSGGRDEQTYQPFAALRRIDEVHPGPYSDTKGMSEWAKSVHSGSIVGGSVRAESIRGSVRADSVRGSVRADSVRGSVRAESTREKSVRNGSVNGGSVRNGPTSEGGTIRY